MTFNTVKDITILIVEDNITLNKIISDMLKKDNFKVKSVVNSKDAYKVIKEDPKSTVMLLDYILPFTTGKEFIKELKNKGYDIPFVIMTSNSDRDTILEMMKVGAYDFIIKNDKFLSLLPSVVYKFIDRIEMKIKLIESQNKLKERERKFKFLTENAQDVIYMLKVHPKVKFEYINSAVKKVLGYSPNDFYNDEKFIFEKIYYENKSISMKKFIENITLDCEKPIIVTCISKSGNKVWLEFRNVPTYENGKLIFLEGIARDITKHVLVEEKLKYISLHDCLTGIYNRTYFENLINRYDKNKVPNVGIIMCDIDGLKIINDTLGHFEGDKLLIAAACVLKECCNNECSIARIGGDEFAISVENCTYEKIESLNNKIKDAVDKFKSKNTNIHLSISTGFCFRKNSSNFMNEVFKKADNNMYSNKLNRKQSSRNSIIKALMKTLQARDFVTEEQAKRIKNLGFKFAKYLKLPNKIVNNICLLAQFHDIGKVGIGDSILKKSGNLTLAEKNEMKRHTEIGYRISNSSNDLMHISQLILKHHEWWNGRGYPLGIKGDNIPLECRIISILDAYDAMTSDRIYREAIGKKEALKELRKFSGIQFDPKLVTKFIKMMEK